MPVILYCSYTRSMLAKVSIWQYIITMHEYSHPSEREERPIVSSLQRLYDDFHLRVADAKEYQNDLADSHYLIQDTFKSYIQSELDTTAQEADAFFDLMLREKCVPDDATFRSDPTAGVETYKLAIFKSVMPIYQYQHSSRDYERWLPSALLVIAPYDGRHSTDVCLRTNGVTDTNCEQGVCPIKTIKTETLHTLQNPDFNSFNYVMDHEKQCRNIQSLLTTVVWREFIPKENKRKLQTNYLNMYMEAFQADS